MRYNHLDMLPEKAFKPIGKSMTLEGGGGGGGQQQTSSTGIDPIMKPYVSYGLGEAKKLYQGASPNYYPGQTYVSPSAQTTQALTAAGNRALGGNPLLPAAQANAMRLQTATNQANPLYQNLYGTSQTSPQAAQDVYSGLASGQISNAANPYNENTASGAYLGSNPYFNQAMQGAGQAASSNYWDAVNAAQSGASQAGRYGSNAQANLFNKAGTTLANSLANKAGELGYNQYANERALQESAIGRMGQLSQSDIGNQLAGASALTGVGQQDYANRMGAASGLATTNAADLQRQMAAAQLAPELANADYTDINQLLKTGQAKEDYANTALQSDINRFNYQENLPTAKLNQYAQYLSGTPQGSTTTSTSSGGGKIVCTAMNQAYGFGSFRQAIWLQHSATMPNAKTIEKGYHTLFLPVVAYAFNGTPNALRNAVRRIAEHIARHRTADLWKEMRGKKRDPLGRIYRAVIEPICYLVGKVKGV